MNTAIRFTFDKLDVIKNELAMIDENWCEWTFVEFLEALEKWKINNLISNEPKSKSSNFRRDQSRAFLAKRKKPETSRGGAQGRVYIVVANNIRQLTVIMSKALKKGRKCLPISACASIAKVPNTESGILRAEILAECAMESTTLRYVTRRKDENQV